MLLTSDQVSEYQKENEERAGEGKKKSKINRHYSLYNIFREVSIWPPVGSTVGIPYICYVVEWVHSVVCPPSLLICRLPDYSALSVASMSPLMRCLLYGLSASICRRSRQRSPIPVYFNTHLSGYCPPAYASQAFKLPHAALIL